MKSIGEGYYSLLIACWSQAMVDSPTKCCSLGLNGIVIGEEILSLLLESMEPSSSEQTVEELRKLRSQDGIGPSMWWLKLPTGDIGSSAFASASIWSCVNTLHSDPPPIEPFVEKPSVPTADCSISKLADCASELTSSFLGLKNDGGSNVSGSH